MPERCTHINHKGNQCTYRYPDPENPVIHVHRFAGITTELQQERSATDLLAEQMIEQSAGSISLVGKLIAHVKMSRSRIELAFSDGSSAILHTASGEPILIGSLLSYSASEENRGQAEERGKELLSGDKRDPSCVAKWPECVDGDYNPMCCRFPKPCSCNE